MNQFPTLKTNRFPLWVVEIMFADDKSAGWNPTCGVALSREEAREAMIEWQQSNPNHFFRVKEYRRYDR